MLETRRLLRPRPAGVHRLRELIEESRALADQPHRSELSINRFQASLWEDLVGARRRARPVGPLERGRPRPRRHHRGRAGRPAGRAAGRAAALPAATACAGSTSCGPRAGRDPGRRHGSGQDAADAGAGRPGPARRSRTVRRSWSSPRPAWCPTGGRGGPVRARPARRLAGRVDGQAAADPSRRCVAGADLVVTSYALLRIECDAAGRLGLVRAGARRGAVREEPPGEDLRRAPAGCRPRSSWPSPARRWRTA